MQQVDNTIYKSIRMIYDDTVEIVMRDNFKFDLEKLKLCYSETHEFTKGRRLKRLVICGKHTDIDREARLFGHEESVRIKDQVIAEALVITGFTQKIIANFYLKFIKDIYPTRVFTDVESAKAWLKSI